jgi:MtN3 and saliva related transmembrane protein
MRQILRWPGRSALNHWNLGGAVTLSSAEWVTLVASIGALCTTSAFVPQVVRVWRLKSASEISLVTFTVFAAGTSAWLVFGFLIDSLPVILANAITLVLALAMVALKLTYARRDPPSLPGASRSADSPVAAPSDQPGR